jgi:hypothetical protein
MHVITSILKPVVWVEGVQTPGHQLDR